jgi:serine/threonine-protein kinase HipA
VLGTGTHQWSSREITLSMALLGRNRHYRMHTVQRRHFNSTARQVGYGPTAEPLIEHILARTPAAIAAVQAELPPDFSPHVAQSILGGLGQAAAALAAMAP